MIAPQAHDPTANMTMDRLLLTTHHPALRNLLSPKCRNFCGRAKRIWRSVIPIRILEHNFNETLHRRLVLRGYRPLRGRTDLARFFSGDPREWPIRVADWEAATARSVAYHGGMGMKQIRPLDVATSSQYADVKIAGLQARLAQRGIYTGAKDASR